MNTLAHDHIFRYLTSLRPRYIYIVKVSGTTSSTVVFTLIIRVKGKFKNEECSHFIFCVANFHIVLFKYVDFL